MITYSTGDILYLLTLNEALAKKDFVQKDDQRVLRKYGGQMVTVKMGVLGATAIDTSCGGRIVVNNTMLERHQPEIFVEKSKHYKQLV